MKNENCELCHEKLNQEGFCQACEDESMDGLFVATLSGETLTRLREIIKEDSRY